jgi:Ca2+-binding EF-hand superfamily protein
VDDLLTSAELVAAATALGAAALNYEAYCTARDALPPKFSRYLTASLFARLPRTAADVLAPLALVAFVREAEVLRAMYRRLALFDATGDGYVREHEVENYVFAAIPAIPELATLQENFYPFYVFTVTRSFFFFLDPNRTGRISLRALVGSRVFAEWTRILPPGHPDLGPCGQKLPVDLCGGRDGVTSTPTPPALGASVSPVSVESTEGSANWFSAANALAVYSAYLALDSDQNGMLSLSEVAAFGGWQYTHAFATRIFDECQTYATSGSDPGDSAFAEIDYKLYLDIVLATENRGSTPALRFYFRLLDVHRVGSFGAAEISFFYSHIQERLRERGHEPVDAANVSNEILDMVNPETPGRITLKDLMRCKVGATVCSILCGLPLRPLSPRGTAAFLSRPSPICLPSFTRSLDVNAFVAYDAREELKALGVSAEEKGSLLWEASDAS